MELISPPGHRRPSAEVLVGLGVPEGEIPGVLGAGIPPGRGWFLWGS